MSDSCITRRPDEELVVMAQAGDLVAFNELCERHLSSVYNRLRALLPHDAVQDVTQDVFLAAVRGIQRFRRQAGFGTWLSGIARHKVADYYRKHRRRPEALSIDDEHDGTGIEWEELANARIALQRLSASYQEILFLRFTEGMPFEQVAETLRISLDAAKSRYRRAVAAFARAFGGVG